MGAETQSPSISMILRSYAFRLGAFAVITLVVFEAVFTAIEFRGARQMGVENGPIEQAQVALALIGAAALFLAAWWTSTGRAVLVVCGAVVAYAAARESDWLFESLLFDDAYKWVVGLPLAILVLFAVFIDRRRCISDVMSLIRHPAATLFVIAGIYLCVVCQALDRPGLWVGINDTSDAAVATKAMVEEYAELFAYALLAFAGIEAAIFAHRQRATANACPNEREAQVHRPMAA